MEQKNQGCIRIDWMGRSHTFVRCISCIHNREDCRLLRVKGRLMLIHSDETKKEYFEDKIRY